MIPIDQTEFAGEGDTKGNCLQAALASLLELPLTAVPHFAGTPTDWYPSMVAWLAEREYSLVISAYHLHDQALGLMAGPSPRSADVNHVVVAMGADMVHDPHPSRAGLASAVEWWYLVPFDPVETFDLEQLLTDPDHEGTTP